jgi:hypothetical protein
MKTLSCVLLLMASLAFVMLGCSDDLAPIAAPNEQALSTAASSNGLAKGGPVVHSATGSAHTILGIGARGGASWFFSFSALQYADGSFGGRVNISDHYNQAKGNFPVVYLNVDNNKRALIVDYGPFPPEWGGGYWYMAYVVEDNSVREKPDQHYWGLALPDIEEMQPYISQLLSTTPEGFFAILAELGGGTQQENLLTVDMGNTQVR